MANMAFREVNPTVSDSQHPQSKLTCPADKLDKKASSRNNPDNSHSRA